MKPKETHVNTDLPTVLPRLERQLTAAAANRVSRPTRSRRSFPLRGRPARLVAVGLAFAALAGTATATGLLEGSVGQDATDGPPTFSSSPVPAGVLDALEVLRRPPSARDQSAAVRANLRDVSGLHFRGLRLDSIRNVAPGPDGATTVFSAEEADAPDGAWRSGDLACLQQDLPVLGSVPQCFEIGEILAGEAFAITGGPGLEFVYGLVPDGIPTVTLGFPHGRSQTVPVADNHFEVRLPNADAKVESLTLDGPT